MPLSPCCLAILKIQRDMLVNVNIHRVSKKVTGVTMCSSKGTAGRLPKDEERVERKGTDGFLGRLSNHSLLANTPVFTCFINAQHLLHFNFPNKFFAICTM